MKIALKDELIGCGRDVGWATKEAYWITFNAGRQWQKHSGAQLNDGLRACGGSIEPKHLRLCIDCARKYGIEW